MEIYNPKYGYFMKTEKFGGSVDGYIYRVYRQKNHCSEWEHIFDISEAQFKILFNLF